MRSYEAARNLYSFLGFLAWSVIVIGVFAAAAAANSVSSRYGSDAALMAMVPGFGISIAGFIFVAFVQMGRASVDTAEYTQQMLKIARDQLEVSRQGLKTEGKSETGFASVVTNETEKLSASFSDRVPTEQSAKAITDGNGKTSTSVSDRVALGLEDGTLEYREKSIDVKGGKFLYNGIPFDTLNAAQKYVDNLVISPVKKSPPKLNKS